MISFTVPTTTVVSSKKYQSEPQIKYCNCALFIGFKQYTEQVCVQVAILQS